MFLGITLMAAFSLSVASDRKDFTDADHTSSHTQYQTIDMSTYAGADLSEETFFEDAEGKDIIIFVHGYNNHYAKALKKYDYFYRQTENLYDHHIGYLWPGGDFGLEYFSARNRVTFTLDRRFLSLITRLSQKANSVDIFAHSMGCRLSLEALSMTEGKPIRNLFIAAAAVDNEVLEPGKRYYEATKHCDRIVVFHSTEDSTLKRAYRLGDFDRALGYKGPQHPDRVPSNVTVIDSSDYIFGHSEYAKKPFAFEHIADILNPTYLAAN